jgi:hypothetical protein
MRRVRVIGLAEQPDPTELWHRVRHRLRATGTRVSAADILAAKDHDRA